VEPAAHHRVGRVVLLFWSAHPERVDAAWEALRARLWRHDIAVVEALRVGADRWWRLVGSDGPTAGVAFDRQRLAAHPFLAQAVVEGRVLHRSRGELAATLDADDAATTRVEACTLVLATRDPAALSSTSAQLAEGTWVSDLVTRHLTTAPRSRPTDAEVARLVCGMQSLRVRDAAWAAVSRATARSGVGFFADVVRRTPRDLLPAAAALLAWSAWQSGDGALAWCALDRCDEVDPGYGLSGLIAEALERAVPPSVMAEGFDWKEGLDVHAS
jgi:hypothetical protein